MANYAVFLEGSNFELSVNGRKEVLGFFSTVRMQAPSKDDAAGSTVERVKSDPRLQEAFRADAAVSPSIEVKVIHELIAENNMKDTGFTFFPMEET